LIGANIDIAAIAGLLAAIGTGVDDQIVILDETTKKSQEASWVRKMKNAFFIIIAAYVTGVASMIPLLFAGAGLLKGFAITSIIGITVGVLITRPAFAAVAEQLLKEE
jgi:preprotein translocase subunit SecD